MNPQLLRRFSLVLVAALVTEPTEPFSVRAQRTDAIGQVGERVIVETELHGSTELSELCYGVITAHQTEQEILNKTEPIAINGYPAHTGATIQTDQTIATTGSEATIDFGSRGRIVLGPNSRIQLKITPQEIRIACLSESCVVVVKAGVVQLEGRYKHSLRQNDKPATLHIGEEAVLVSHAYLTINYEVVTSSSRRTGSVLIALLAILGIGAGVAVGTAVGSGDTPLPLEPYYLAQ